MSQPVSMGKFTVVSGTAAGTTVVSASPCSLVRVFVPANRTGTVSFYDCATADGTTASGVITDITCTVGSIPTSIELGISTHEGITCVTGGTTNLVVITE